MDAAVPIDLFTFGIDGSAPAENRLGQYGYSWDLALRNFLPVLGRLGAVEVLASPESQLEDRVRRSLAAGRQPLVLAFRPFQDACRVHGVPVMNYCFWEFPDIPAEALGGNSRADWKRMAGEVDMILCASTTAAEAFRRAGVQTPLCVVPPPLSPHWFETNERTALANIPALELAPTAFSDVPKGMELKKRFHSLVRRWLPPAVVDLAAQARKRLRRSTSYVPPAPMCAVGGDEVVFTFVFNPDDSRKAWQDLLAGFLISLRDRPDATLIFKLVAQPDRAAHALTTIAAHVRALSGHRPRCRFLVGIGRWSEEQMRSLVSVSSWYVNSTRAEGCCLPLLEAMASGRPGISPVHTAMTDYMTTDAGLLFQSFAEPCVLPGDASGRLQTTWQRVCWPSLCEQLVRAYEIRKRQPGQYQAMASAARAAAFAWASEGEVLRRLREAIGRLSAVRHGAFKGAA